MLSILSVLPAFSAGLALTASVAVSPTDRFPGGFVAGQRFADGRGLVAVSLGEGRQLWFTLPTSFRDDEVVPGAHAALSEVDEILASPDGRYLAVLSSSEDHPGVEIVDLPTLLDGRGWLVVASLDPYPGKVSIRSWRDGALLLKSDLPLTRCGEDCENLPAGSGREPRAFRLVPETRELTELTALDHPAGGARILALDYED